MMSNSEATAKNESTGEQNNATNPIESRGKQCQEDSTSLSSSMSPSSSFKVEQIPSERELLVFQAELCLESGRFEDMVETMKDLCQLHSDLKENERTLLSCAYKNVIGCRRTAWRIFNELLDECKPQVGGDKQGQQTTPRYDPRILRSRLKIIGQELRMHCSDIIAILDTRLLTCPTANGESKVFYYKMKGDYMRYLCEICQEPERKDKANESLLAYKTASELATIELPPTHPVRLGLALNFSVFYYEIMRSPERSCRLAKQAFDDAIAELDTLSEESYRDSTIIMQLLRDNLNLWESEQNLQGVVGANGNANGNSSNNNSNSNNNATGNSNSGQANMAAASVEPPTY